VEHCDRPKRVKDLFPLLFKAPIGNSMLVLATGESYAHLHYLMAQGKLTMQTDKSGVNWYQRV
jgi:hypothetical protein